MPYCNHLSLIFGFFKCLSFRVCLANSSETFGCVTDLDTLFLVMGFIYLDDEIQFLRISSCYICIRSVPRRKERQASKQSRIKRLIPFSDKDVKPRED